MKSTILTATLVIFNLMAIAQTDTAFWNQSMIDLAESNSIKGWIRVKQEKNYSSDNFTTLNKNAFGLKENDSLLRLKSFTDDIGFIHHKYQHLHKGLKVEGSEYILHEQDGIIKSANGNLTINLDKEVVPVIDETTALNIALGHINASKYGWEAYKNEDSIFYSNYPTGELLLAFNQNNGNFSNENYQLTYRFEITTVEPSHSKQAVYVNAHNGEIYKTENLICNHHCNCCQGTTITLYHGSQYITTKHNGFPLYNYLLIDQCRGGGIQPYYNGNKIRDPNNNFVNNHKDKVGASVHWATEMTYDYFLNNFGRNSFDGNGAKINLYTGPNAATDNAFWDGSDLYFGAGGSLASNDLVSLDVVGHEFTHAVTQYSAGLVYSYQSGALNESFSDIFGTMIEYYGLNGNGDYLIGEDFWIADGKLRDMQNPKSKNQPDTYNGTHWWTSSGDNGGVHTNSGVQNFWFYLLSEGGTGINDLGNNYTVQGIGRNKAAAIAYRNLTVYLTSTSDYSDAKNGAIWSAMDLFGTCSNEVLQTIRAWDAVGVSSIGGIGYDVFVSCSLLNFIHNQGQPFTARAIHNLESDCDISSSSTAQVTFIAGNSITLKPGFHSGPNFHAYIDPCLSSIQLRMAENSGENYSNNYDTQFKHDHDLESNFNMSFDESSKEFNVYPNPSNGQVSIVIDESTDKDVEIHVHDPLGKLITSEKVTGKKKISIDLSNEPKGIYFINLIKEKKIYSKKVILD